MSTVETIRGPVELGSLGPTLMHEHVFVMSTEHMQNYGSSWWDEEVRVSDAVDKLNRLHAKGVTTIVDPTVWGLGRYIPRIQRVAEQTPVNIVAATGLYAYEELPHHYAYRGPGALADMPEPLITDFVRDIEVGIADTGVKAAFLKCCVEASGLTPGVERIARAVARTSVRTGVPITVHTSGPAQTGRLAADLFAEEGVDLTKVVIGHAGDSNDLDYLTELADRGLTLGMDRFGLDIFNPGSQRIATVAALAARGYADRMVLAHDASCFIDYFGDAHDQTLAASAPNWHYEHISDDVLPALLAAGVTQAQIDQMMIENPVRYFSGEVVIDEATRAGIGGVFDTRGVTRGPDGVKRYDGLPSSLVAMLREVCDRQPAAEAVSETGGGRTLTYRELWDGAAAVAGGLRAAGVRRGDRTAIRLDNGVDWVLAFLGSVLAGAVAVPVNTRLAPEEVDFVLSDSGAGFVFLPGEELPHGTPLVVDDLGPSDPVAIFYTSGTTGFPKGAVTTHENLLSNAETVRRGLYLEPEGTRTLISVPLFHVTGCNSQLLVALYVGGTAVIMPAFEVGAFLKAIPDERINTLVTVPAIYWLAMNQPAFAGTDVSGVRVLAYGGAPIAPDLVARIVDAFPQARVTQAFGLTESASVTTFLPHELVAHADSVGFAVPVCDVRVDDTVVAGEGVGELLIRGPNVVAGYWGRDEATKATFGDGWLHTGDVARIDADGLVFLVDRIKDLINRGGENVYCVEVENALAGAPGVYEAAVVGVPDAMMGEKVGAVIFPLPGVELDPDAVVAHLSAHLADFKVPQYVAVSPTPLPRNPGGKLLKRALRESVRWDDAFRR